MMTARMKIDAGERKSTDSGAVKRTKAAAAGMSPEKPVSPEVVASDTPDAKKQKPTKKKATVRSKLADKKKAAAKPKAAATAKKIESDEDLSEEDEISVDTAAPTSRRTGGRARSNVNYAATANNSDCDDDTS